MAHLAIKGHPTRGSEVIALLEMLGGVNTHNLYGDENYSHYTIDDNKKIIGSLPTDKFVFFTLERFLEKFPYKVGDKVNSPCKGCVKTVTSMNWDSYLNTVTYKLDDKIYTTIKQLEIVNDLPTIELENKPDLLQQLKDYFDNTPREIIEKEWHEYDKYNEISPKVNEYLDYVNNIRQSKYPKTYEECCDILGGNNTIHVKELILFKQLINARNAYWKIAGEEMGLGKPFEPDWSNAAQRKYCIVNTEGNVLKWVQKTTNKILAFPTEEMRDAFYENFKDLIEKCKELL